MSKSVKKVMEESRTRGLEEIDLQDKGINNIADVPYLCEFLYIIACKLMSLF